MTSGKAIGLTAALLFVAVLITIQRAGGISHLLTEAERITLNSYTCEDVAAEIIGSEMQGLFQTFTVIGLHNIEEISPLEGDSLRCSATAVTSVGTISVLFRWFDIEGSYYWEIVTV